MGTGVKGMAENVEGAASIMRQGARRLRAEIGRITDKVKAYDESSKEERRRIEALSAEVQKLESAARLLEPDPIDQDGESAQAEKSVEKAQPEKSWFPKVRMNEVFNWKEDATSIHISGRGPNGLIFSFSVPEDDFAHIGTPKFNERIERLIDAKARCTPMDKDKL